ncbi:MAG: response regulator [Pseudomonadota bacterium]
MRSAAQTIVEEESGAALKAHALLRAKLCIPLALLACLALWQWGSRSGSIRIGAIIVLAAVSLLYIFAALFFATRMQPFSAKQLATYTSALDPLIVSAWLVCLGTPGFVFVCLYLFTILECGKRLGSRAMLISQIASLAGYGGVMIFSTAWEQQPALALANLLLVAGVPFYFRAMRTKSANADGHPQDGTQAASRPANQAEPEPAMVATPIVPVVYGKRVLVAGSNGADLILIRDLLERDRHTVTVSNVGQQAIDIMSSLTFDIIFMEPMVGDLDGASILQLYRFDKTNPAPTFFITADTSTESAGKLLESGATAVLQKPLTSMVLRHAISQVFPEDALAKDSEAAPAIALKPSSLRYIDERSIQDLQDIGAGPEFLSEILTTAIIDIETTCRKIVDAIDQDDFSKIRPGAHALRGVSSSVGATQLAGVATQLMQITEEDMALSKDRWRRDVAQLQVLSINALRDILLTANS